MARPARSTRRQRRPISGITRRQIIQGAAAVAAAAALPRIARAQAADSAGPAMASAATAFLAALPADARARAVFAFEDRERLNWHYVPRQRAGVAFKEMPAAGRSAAHDLMKASLSAAGYAKAADVIRLEGVLRQLETLGSLLRDPDNYAVSVFGTPGASAPWGWRVEGHHLSLNFTLAPGKRIAVTPAFMGANPAEVKAGPLKGLRVLGQEQDLGRALAQGMNADQRRRMIIAARSLGDIVAGPSRTESLAAPAGVPGADLTAPQRELLMRLVEEYARNMRGDLAEVELRRIRESGVERLSFAWAGPLDPGHGHYYRVHGPVVLIELDNTQNDANHIHSVWRNPASDFGADLLRAHYEHGHSHLAVRVGAMARRPDSLIYAVGERPPLATTIALGLQQVSLMAIYLVMVVVVVRRAGAPPAVAQSAVSLGLFAMGLSAGLQALPRGPVGSGYLAPPVLSAIYLPPSLLAVAAGGLPMVFGMTIVAGLFEAVLSRLLPKLRLVFPPLVCGFIVAAVGIELGLVGIKELLDVGGRGRFDVHVGVATLTLIVMVALAVWGRGMLRLLCSLVGLIAGFAVAGLAGLASRASIEHIATAPIAALPGVGHIGYAFDAALLVPFVLAGLAAGLRTVGVVTTCQRINDADWKRPDLRSIQGGVLADGLGCAVGGCLGTVGMGSAPSLVGVTQASGATSRVIAYAVAGVAAVLACSPKLSAVFLALPESVVGGGLVFTASFMVAGGIQIIAARELDARKTFVVGVALLLGLSRAMFPEYYGALPRGLQALTGSLLSVAMIAAIALNLLFHLGLRRTAQLVLEVGGKREADDAAIAEVMTRSARSWKIGPGIAERAADVAERTVHLIQDSRLADGPITVKIAFDEVTLDIGLEYRGDLLSLPAHRPVSEDNMVEEQPFVKGLSGFLVDVYADRVRSSIDEGLCRITLTFDA